MGHFDRRWRRLAATARRTPERPLAPLPVGWRSLWIVQERPVPSEGWRWVAVACACSLMLAAALPVVHETFGGATAINYSLRDLPKPPGLPSPPVSGAPKLPDALRLPAGAALFPMMHLTEETS